MLEVLGLLENLPRGGGILSHQLGLLENLPREGGILSHQLGLLESLSLGLVFSFISWGY